MEYLIAPDDCLLLKTIHETASLREAALQLKCDPAGLTRRIQKLAEETGLIQKVGLRWKVTSRGLDLVAWVNDSVESQKRMLTSRQNLRIAATAWFAEEVLIPHLGQLPKFLGHDISVSVHLPEKGLEPALLDGSVDFVMTCHPPENPEIEHRSLIAETWVIVTPKSWEAELRKHAHPLELLANKPYVRHLHLNHDLFLPELKTLTESNYSFDTLAAVKTAVRCGYGWSVVPRFLVDYELQQKHLYEVRYELDVKDRRVCLWWLRNRLQPKRLSTKLAPWLKQACGE